MKINHRIIYGLLLCTLSLTVKAQQEYLSLDSVLARVAANPLLRTYDAQINAQNAYAGSARSLDAPKLSAGQYQTPYQLKPDGGSFMVTADQMFTNPAKLRAKENYMKSISRVTAEEKKYMNNQLNAQAKQYYFERAILEKKLAVLDNTSDLLEYMLKASNIRLTYGKEKLDNIYKTKAELFQLDNSREEIKSEIKQKNILLNTLMNRDKGQDFMVDTSLVVRDYAATVTDTATLASVRSDIRGIDRSIELQQLNAKVEYSKRKPDFGLQAGHMFSYGGMPNQYILMGSITIPIAPWSSKSYKANLKGNQYEIDQQRERKISLLNQAEGELAGLKAAWTGKSRQLKNYRQNIIPALQNSYKTSLLVYEQNTGELLPVLESIKSLQTARIDALERLGEILLIQVAYEKENEMH